MMKLGFIESSAVLFTNGNHSAMNSEPLLGKTFLNTRAKEQALSLTELLTQAGAKVEEFPMLEIARASDFSFDLLAEKLHQVQECGWLVFTSANGVRQVLEELMEASNQGRGEWMSMLRSIPVAVIGESTASVAREQGLAVQFVAETSNSESFADELLQHFGASLESKPERVLLLRGRIASQSLPEMLSQGGLGVDSMSVYDSITPTPAEKNNIDLNQALERIDMMIFTSSEAVRNFFRILEHDSAIEGVYDIPTAVIGPKTAATVDELGLKCAVVASEPQVETLVENIVEYYTTQP